MLTTDRNGERWEIFFCPDYEDDDNDDDDNLAAILMKTLNFSCKTKI